MTHVSSQSPVDRLGRSSRRAAIGVFASALLLVPLTPSTTAQDDEPINVVTSFSVLADIVENVGGDHVAVTSLVPVGGGAHTFDPSPDQIATLADADLVVKVGGDFEPWLDDLVESSGSSATVFEAFPDHHIDDDHTDEHGDDHADEHANGATPADDHADEHGDDHADDHGDDHADDHADDAHADEATPTDDHGDDHADDEHAEDDLGHEGEEHGAHSDLHAWLDVHNTIHTVENISETLAEIDPDNADAYLANTESYVAELEELETYIIDQTETLPENERLLITTHQTFDPFAEAYGYEVVGVLLESHTTVGADAPASHLAELVGIVQDNDIPAVFSDTPGGESILEPLATEAGIEVAPSLYVDTLGEEGSGAETYIDMMRHNIDTIVTALGA
jgi:ABC-type Zn uptake system ZnuABC Zn-binding protein ZnuA